LIDAIVERLSPNDCLNRIANNKPDAIIALTGAVSIKEDIHFFKNLKKIIASAVNETNLLYFLSGLVLLTALSLAVWFGYQYFGGSSPASVLVELKKEEKEKPCEYARVLDGVCVESEDRMNPKLAMVMIDNHMDAHPQVGLSQARVVYEAPVEANFTRFLAIYPVDLEIKKVGPVRSARPYFLDWVSEYGNPMYLHCGGSVEALADMRIYGTNDFDEMSRGWYFWRDNNRFAPHNLFTNSELWNEALADYEKNYVTDKYVGWKFGEIKSCDTDCVNEIMVSFSSVAFESTWKYNSSTMQYERWQSGSLHRDENGVQIVADTVIIQKVNTTVLDGVGRLGMDTIGSGEAMVFVGGNVFEGEWKKDSRKARTKWFDSAGEEIGLQSGKIWVEVANERADVEFGN